MLWGPTYLNIAILPDKFKELALEKLEHAQQKRLATDSRGKIRGLPDLQNYLYSADPDLERLQACRTNLQKLDKVRGNSYTKSLPILKEIFDECL